MREFVVSRMTTCFGVQVYRFKHMIAKLLFEPKEFSGIKDFKDEMSVVFIEELMHRKNMGKSLIHGGIILPNGYGLLAKCGIGVQDVAIAQDPESMESIYFYY
ncbi:uncharacterized protein LOC125191382 [Salvia hispanica]|uniref:uncharacterized protein LOC125191382 n=1 Tax=Salvia hispanica TaxID=49212 RepID=UPI00200971F9|nr:uncharacterized protein LOC125191382 [Salvia hispanica]